MTSTSVSSYSDFIHYAKVGDVHCEERVRVH